MIIDRRSFMIGGAAVTLTLAAPAGAQAPATAQVAGVQRFDVGDAVVTALSDGYIDLDLALFQGASPEEMNKLLARAFQAPGKVRGSVNAYVVAFPGRTILIDAGGGSGFAPTLGQVAGHLEAAGVAPGDIEAVAVTHLHPDHVGGLTDASGAPVFGNAELLVHETEIGFWRDDAIRGQAPEEAKAFFDMARKALDAYGERVRPVKDGEVAPGLTATLLPGHTPGHTGFTVSSGDRALLVWGDIVHAPPLQFARPEIATGFDTDPELGRRTRAGAFDRAASDRLMVAGMHLFFPGVGHVVKAGTGYEFEPARWEYVIE